ncbi:MAG: hypothetical protein AAB421_03640 [Patescibacteria group bacterium]
MLQKLLIVFILIFLIAALGFRLSGSGAEIARRTEFFNNPFTPLFATSTPNKSTTTTTGLPFPFPATPDLPDEVSNYTWSDTEEASSENLDVAEELLSLERSYDEMRTKLSEARVLGELSPHREHVHILDAQTSALQAGQEYVVIGVDYEATAPIDVTGWSLQRTTDGARVRLPVGTRIFEMGTIPTFGDITLERGAEAVITTGVSPVGTSFRENTCTGHLSQFQTFIPSIEERCPNPLAELGTEYFADESCRAFVETIPRCSFFIGVPPSPVSSACYSFVRNELTYNGCVARNRWRPSFLSPRWRIYLGQPALLWEGSGTIRLLDREGRTVDVWRY